MSPQQVPNEIPQRAVASVDAPDVGWALLRKSITHSRRLSAVSSKTPQTPERLENELCSDLLCIRNPNSEYPLFEIEILVMSEFSRINQRQGLTLMSVDL